MGKDTSREQITINQHYVPRVYMKNFGTIVNEGERNEKVFVSFYQFHDDLYKENIPTQSICYKSYFYGEDGAIEKDFANRERKWSIAIKHIINANSYDLDSEQENDIKEFAIYQFNRTLAIYNFTKRSMADLLTESLAMSTPHLEKEIIREITKDKVDNEVKPAYLIEACDEYVSCIHDLEISIIKFTARKRLITSDMPIVITNPAFLREGGLVNAGIFIIFPLSPNTAVAILDKLFYPKCEPFMIISQEEDVLNLNKYQVLSSTERIISTLKDDFEKDILSKDTLELKKEFNAEKSVDSSHEPRNIGAMFAVHSRTIPFYFPLSFCALPKSFRKIISDSRVAFPRDYSFAAWFKLLVAAYQIPELMKSNHSLVDIPNEKIKRLKDGNIKMLKFAEDYWNIPLKDRTITPILMKQIKTTCADYWPLDQ
jgi:hypothetical protein